MIDIHCHILPGVDDGPVELAGALEMARIAVADGTRILFATPHIHPDGLERSAAEVAVMAFRAEVAKAGIELEILQGGDISSRVAFDEIRLHVLHRGPYLLIEFPHSHLPDDAPDLLFELVAEGLVPIVTHPERNPAILRDPRLVDPLLEAGGLVQLTAGSLTGEFGAEARACARHLLRQGQAHFLASDGHSPDWRAPRLSAGLVVAEKLVGRERARRLVIDNPARVVTGERL